MTIIRFFIISVFVSLMSPAIMAKPDISFADSARYRDAYLAHEFVGNNIKFKMTNDAVRMAIPAHSYNLDALVNFASNQYIFANRELKPDFERMFQESFESQFTTLVFLEELVLLLNSFQVRYPEYVH